ncbi:MAG: outer membrane lipoprotein LolB [Pseudomonadota bacterium]|nr:outer membrane lipoprotein LolB [Pseudomonadota bacterium]
MIRRIFALASVALALTGCATANLSHAPVAAYRDTVNLAGSLSASFQKDGKLDSITVKYDWQQTPDRIDVNIATPLGQTVAKISVTPESATLTQADRAPRVAKDLESLTRDALGWSLPVSGLRDWLQGYATGADGKRFTASPFNNEVVTRDGWHVRFASWQDDAAAVPQPKRIDASRLDTNGDALALRIAVRPAD